MQDLSLSQRQQLDGDLRQVLKLLQRGWTQHAMARDWLGRTCNSYDRWARKWCLSGACNRVDVLSKRPYYEINNAVREQIPRQFGGFVGFNDDPATTKADVLAVVERAIDANRQAAEAHGWVIT